MQPAGIYTVKTDEALLEIDPGRQHRSLGAGSGPGSTFMIKGRLAMEPSLDDLLADEVLQQAVRSAGLTSGEFREQLRNLGARLERSRLARLE